MFVTPFGPSGKSVYERTYSRPRPDGSMEIWNDTVGRVAEGNLSLVYGDSSLWPKEVWDEFDELCYMMSEFKIIPGGRHLWASGTDIPFLFNCWTAGWEDKIEEHSSFTFLRLMEGGGVGANYSSLYTSKYAPIKNHLDVRFACHTDHANYGKIANEGFLADTPINGGEDSSWVMVGDSREGWAQALEMLLVYSTYPHLNDRQIVFDVSGVRPEGAPLKTTGGTASGPLPLIHMLEEIAYILNYAQRDNRQLTPLEWMDIDHAVAKSVVAGGVRRSARMSIMHWKDEYILPFIHCKQHNGKHWSTNISVEIDDEFLFALQDQWHPFYYKAWEVHAEVTKGMLENGEPGYWNSSLSNKGEVNPVYCTNPCGEITLEPYEPCCLGHVNLDAFVFPDGGWDWQEVENAHRLMTRFLVRATFAEVSDSKSKEILEKNRRIGVGHLGVQGFLNKKGIKYSEAHQSWFPAFLHTWKMHVREVANAYAHELRIPAPIKTTTVAPTGTIAKMPGVTEGIHPVYAKFFIRRIRFSSLRPEEMAQVDKYREDGYHVEPCKYSANTWVVAIPMEDKLVHDVKAMGLDPDIVESSADLDLKQMLTFQAMYQDCYADNAVSFTLNVDPTQPQNSQIMLMADLVEWLPRLKGTTVFPDKSREQAPYTRLTKEEYMIEQLRVLGRMEEELDMYDSSNSEECAGGACPVK